MGYRRPTRLAASHAVLDASQGSSLLNATTIREGSYIARELLQVLMQVVTVSKLAPARHVCHITEHMHDVMRVAAAVPACRAAATVAQHTPW
jgi:hypothetical protein